MNLAFGANVPTWAHEGLAVLFESAGREDGTIAARSVPWSRMWYLQAQIKANVVSLDRLLALAAATAKDPQVRDLAEAERQLAIADDLGRGHENEHEHVRARLLAANGKTAEAVALLQQAAGLDRFGLGS